MPFIRLIIIAVLFIICFFLFFEYKEANKMDYYKIVKDNKESMIDIFMLNKETHQKNDLINCELVKNKLYNNKITLFNKGFVETVFFGWNERKYSSDYFNYHSVKLFYNDNQDFLFCFSENKYLNNEYNLFQYLPNNTIVYSFEKCEGGYNLGRNRMFKIENHKFYYCEN